MYLLNTTTGLKTVNVVKGLFRIDLLVWCFVFLILSFCACFRTVVTNSSLTQNKSQHVQGGRDFKIYCLNQGQLWDEIMTKCFIQLVALKMQGDCTTFMSNVLHYSTATWWQIFLISTRKPDRKSRTSKGWRRNLSHISHFHSSHL